MIKLNNQEYKKYIVEIEWGKFSSNISGVKEEGLAPIIRFIINNKITIDLELIYSIDKFKNLEINKKIDLNKYLVDVSYEDNSGWMPVYNDSISIYLTRLNENEFHIDFKLKYNDFGEKINIIINDNLKIL